METLSLKYILLAALALLGVYGYFLMTPKGKKLNLEGASWSYSSLWQSSPFLKFQQFIDGLFNGRAFRLPSFIMNPDSEEASTMEEDRGTSQALKDQQRVLNLEKRTRELTKQRDQLGLALQHMQARQDSLLEKSKLIALDNLRAGIAHELNNALNVVGGVLTPIRRDFEELKGHVQGESAEMLIQEVEVLLKDLSESAARASGSAANFIKMLPNREGKDAEEHDLYELFKAKLHWQRIIYPEIRFNFRIEKGLKVFGDISELLLTVHTLLVNAIDASYREPNPKIDLAILETGAQLVIVVADNGVGVPDELKGKIFEPFFTTKQRADAVGLGLFTIHGLITNIHGSIEVKANPDGEGGTIFSVNIPLEKRRGKLKSGKRRVASIG